MRNLTIKIENTYYNYDNIENFKFLSGKRGDGNDVYWVEVWGVNGKYSEHYLSKEKYETAKERLESGLINGNVFIDLNIQ